MTYHADIDGLRAISVLLALAFPLDAALVPGGFVGIDVFFGISGHLTTRAITDETAAEPKFSSDDTSPASNGRKYTTGLRQ
jgi:peptidoglycan/LPS O-acetylase OafA/YrhL